MPEVLWKIDQINRMITLNENTKTLNDNTDWLWSQKVASTVYEMSKIFLIEYVSYCSTLKTISFEKSLAKNESFAFSDNCTLLN
jgi:gluconate kinase